MNGFQLLGWLKMQPEFDQVPRVVLTASNQERDRKQAEELGCRDYFVKPPGLDKLVEIISVLVRSGARSTARHLVLQGDNTRCAVQPSVTPRRVQSAKCKGLGNGRQQAAPTGFGSGNALLGLIGCE
jgi:DNA-binding response OmpR family regulator